MTDEKLRTLRIRLEQAIHKRKDSEIRFAYHLNFIYGELSVIALMDDISEIHERISKLQGALPKGVREL